MDHASLEKLYTEYSAPVANFLQKLSGSKDTAFDLMQDTFMRLGKALTEGKKIHNEKSYIFKIAYNLLLDWKRAPKNHPMINSDAIPEFPSLHFSTEEIEWKILKDSIMERLESEGEIFSHIFCLRVDYDMTHREIAQITGKSHNTVDRYFEMIQKILIADFGDALNLKEKKFKK
jgi:RNA polymerase sigma-70 factor (ECF subfamily)